MQQVLEWLSNTAVHWIDAFGLIGVFIAMTLESACIPIPSEVILLSAGAAAATGSMSYLGIVAAGVLGNVAGSIIAYYAGAFGGRKVLDRYGKYVLINSSHIDQAQRWFDLHGEGTVFFARNLPFVRTFISFPAGIAGMHFRKFVVYTFLGCIPWNMALAYIGIKLSIHSDKLEQYLHPLSYALAIAALVLLVYWILRHRRKQA
ncbi:DedA family protein [Paenibacillus rhizovicinus]|uniref:DedA family protein n=1 Tax=Paenibacillus rhizovicinus TaxID=2704463 RepID=A0A6C0P5R6_9BACL|nr:DedA family protein [Paenibacillus rhizovicinus]QHW33646.1 DedA family protein [Paenibacillus rhizovicinus]